MSNKMLVDALKTILKVYSFLGPVGSVVGMAIDKGTKTDEAFAHSKEPNVSSISQSIKIPDMREIGMWLLDLSASMTNQNNNISDVSRSIRDFEHVLDDFESFKKKINEKVNSTIERIANDLISTANNFEVKSSVSLDVTTWQVKLSVEDTLFEIQQFTRGFKVDGSPAKVIQKIKEVSMILIKVYDRIQDYQKQQRIYAYLADLSSVSVQQVVVSDPKLVTSFRELQISIRSNIILDQYNTALNAFKQWIFPCVRIFLKKLKLNENLLLQNLDITALASTVETRIEDMKLEYLKYKNNIEDFDRHIISADFNGSSEVTQPFYVWKNKEHREMITKLLAGETVLAQADVLNSDVEKDAIKFRTIELGFRSRDPVIQAQINRALSNYCVSMTHLGISNYRYDGQIFPIAGSSQTIIYSFKKSANGSAVYGNDAYFKLLSGDIMLSPYTMWQLKLTGNPFKFETSFNMMANFSGKVDLLLEGSGNFFIAGETTFAAASFYKVGDFMSSTEGLI